MNRVSTKAIRAQGHTRSDARPRTRIPHAQGSALVHGVARTERRIRVKRAYEPASAQDGQRVLVDRLWPRGLSRENLQLRLWLKEIAPSPRLRKWFGHDSARWKEFRERYARELREKRDELAVLERLARDGVVTLVYAAHDTQHNHAIVLAERLDNALKGNSKHNVATYRHGDSVASRR